MKRVFLPLLMVCGVCCGASVWAAEEAPAAGAQEAPKAAQPADATKPAEQAGGEEKKKQADKKEGGGGGEEPGCDK